MVLTGTKPDCFFCRANGHAISQRKKKLGMGEILVSFKKICLLSSLLLCLAGNCTSTRQTPSSSSRLRFKSNYNWESTDIHMHPRSYTITFNTIKRTRLIKPELRHFIFLQYFSPPGTTTQIQLMHFVLLDRRESCKTCLFGISLKTQTNQQNSAANSFTHTQGVRPGKQGL